MRTGSTRIAPLAVAALVAALQASPSLAAGPDGVAAPARQDAAVARWRPLADAGDRQAQCALGRAYMTGQGVEADQAQGVRWMMKCARQGDTPAAVVVAVAFENGKGVERSEAEAARWYLVAAAAGDVDSQRTMATWYARGRGVPKDAALALTWFYAAYGLQSPDEAVFVKFYLPDIGARDLERARTTAREHARRP